MYTIHLLVFIGRGLLLFRSCHTYACYIELERKFSVRGDVVSDTSKYQTRCAQRKSSIGDFLGTMSHRKDVKLLAALIYHLANYLEPVRMKRATSASHPVMSSYSLEGRIVGTPYFWVVGSLTLRSSSSQYRALVISSSDVVCIQFIYWFTFVYTLS